MSVIISEGFIKNIDFQNNAGNTISNITNSPITVTQVAINSLYKTTEDIYYKANATSSTSLSSDTDSRALWLSDESTSTTTISRSSTPSLTSLDDDPKRNVLDFKKYKPLMKTPKNQYINSVKAIIKGPANLAIHYLQEINTYSNVIDVNKSYNSIVKFVRNNPYMDFYTSPKKYVHSGTSVTGKAMFTDKATLGHIDILFQPDGFSYQNITPFQSQSNLLHPIGSLSSNEAIDFSQHNHSNTTINLKLLNDDEIFEGAISLRDNEVISFNNLNYNGSHPNIKLNFDIKFKDIFQGENRLSDIINCLSRQHLNLKSITTADTINTLITKIANTINEKDLPMHEKITEFENVIFDVVVILLGKSSSHTLYELSFFDQSPLVRDYFNYSHNGSGLINLSSYHQDTNIGTTSLNIFIKQGGGDCRGTNTLYGCLLNVGYQIIAPQVEAKLIYAKVKEGSDANEFYANQPADHNMVLIKNPEKDHLYIKDAFFNHYNGHNLKDLIAGKIVNQLAVQITSANCYPNEQKIKF